MENFCHKFDVGGFEISTQPISAAKQLIVSVKACVEE